MALTVTEEMRSMIASAFVGAIDTGTREHSLCCAQDRLEACAVIVGRRYAQALQSWVYDALGCDSHGPEMDQHLLDKITQLTTLRME